MTAPSSGSTSARHRRHRWRSETRAIAYRRCGACGPRSNCAPRSGRAVGPSRFQHPFDPRRQVVPRCVSGTAARERTERATREVDSPSSLQSGVSSRTSQRRPAASGRAALRKEVSVLADRPRKRANPDEIAVDLHALSNSSCSAGTYDEPCAFRNRGGVPSITEKRPRQPRVIFGVRVDSRVPVVGARASVPSSGTWYEFRLRRWSQRKRRPTNSARSG